MKKILFFILVSLTGTAFAGECTFEDSIAIKVKKLPYDLFNYHRAAEITKNLISKYRCDVGNGRVEARLVFELILTDRNAFAPLPEDYTTAPVPGNTRLSTVTFSSITPGSNIPYVVNELVYRVRKDPYSYQVFGDILSADFLNTNLRNLTAEDKKNLEQYQHDIYNPMAQLLLGKTLHLNADIPLPWVNNADTHSVFKADVALSI